MPRHTGSLRRSNPVAASPANGYFVRNDDRDRRRKRRDSATAHKRHVSKSNNRPNPN